MIGLIHSLRYEEKPHIRDEVIKGYVTGLQRNNAGLYMFDIAAVRGNQHADVLALTGVREQQVHVIGKNGLKGAAVNIRFEAEPYDVFRIEIHSHTETGRPTELELDEVADSLWYAANYAVGVNTDIMEALLFEDINPKPISHWYRKIGELPIITEALPSDMPR